MHRMQFVPAIYNIYVCDRRHILKDITIIVRKLDTHAAMEKAIGKVEKLQADGKSASLLVLRGLSHAENEYYTKHSRGMKRGTSFHERFHARVTEAGVTKDHGDSELEESAAYAYETVMDGADTRVIRSYGWFARQSVRFLFALDTPGQEELLVDSMSRLTEKSVEIIAGDPFAAAMSSAVDCAFYLECLAVLRRWGHRDGERILVDAIAVNRDDGPDCARRFLIGHIRESEQERIERSYGVDLNGFRFRSIISPKLVGRILEW